jgi:hypothetical protein
MQALLLFVILGAWLLLTIAPAGRRAVEDELRGVAPESRRGVSVLPVFPLFPLLVWAVGWGLSAWLSEHVASLLLYLHIGMAFVCGLVILRDIRRLRSIRATQSSPS